MTAPTDLIERLEAASVGTRELDEAVIRTLTDAQVVARFGDYEWRPEGVGIWRAMPSPTTSLDAALALAERVFPNAFWNVQHMAVVSGERMFFAELYPEDGDNPEGWEGFARSPALALVAAILRASEQSK